MYVFSWASLESDVDLALVLDYDFVVDSGWVILKINGLINVVIFWSEMEDIYAFEAGQELLICYDKSAVILPLSNILIATI